MPVLKGFMGSIPRLAPEHLPQNAAQTALNVNLRSGDIKAWKATKFIETPTKVGTKKTIYLFNDTTWFHWIANVNVVPGLIADDSALLTYYSGDSEPKLTYSPIATSGGGTSYPNNSYLLGVPAPLLTPVAAAVSLSPGTITSITASDTTQLVTITSAAHGLSTGHSVTLSGLGATDVSYLNDKTYRINKIDANTFTLVLTGEVITVAASATTGTWTRVYTYDTIQSRIYVYTYVLVYGSKEDESKPSEPVSIDCALDQQVNLTLTSTGPTGNYLLTNGKKRIYRSDDGGDYRLVAEIAIGTTTYSDTTLTADLEFDVLPSTDWDVPPSDLAGLMLLPCGSVAGFHGKEWCPSEPYQPHTYPTPYRLTTAYNIVGHVAYGDNVAIMTNGDLYVAAGTHPENYQMSAIEGFKQPCVSARSIVDVGYGAMYAAPDGLVLVDSGGARLITEELFSKENWQALSPSSILGVYYDDKYFGFYDTGTTTGGFILDPKNPGASLTFTDVFATAAFNDSINDALYLVVSGNIVQWDNHATNYLTYTWKSKKQELPVPINYGACQVVASAYPVTLKVYADGTLKTTKTVADAKPFRLTGGFLARSWEIEVSGTAQVKTIKIGTSIRGLNE